MNKFELFEKSNAFHWTTNKIYYCGVFSCIGFGYTLHEFSIPGEKFFQWLTIFILIIGLVLKFINFAKIESLQGELNGYISFQLDSITTDKFTYILEKIKKIQISNDDYSGKLLNYSKGNIGPALSNGTNNFIIISLYSGKTIKFNFQLINSNDFQKVKLELLTYYRLGKLEFCDLANILGDKSTLEIRQLKAEIEKEALTANNR